MKRAGNNPKRRISAAKDFTETERSELLKAAAYTPSGHHKRNPADYGLERTNPRPTKSLCDKIRIIPLKEASLLLRKGISAGMVSTFKYGKFPKYIWSVGEDEEVYEAKTEEKTAGTYHGYRLEEEDDMRELVKRVWKER
jgi:hypothetical protein